MLICSFSVDLGELPSSCIQYIYISTSHVRHFCLFQTWIKRHQSEWNTHDSEKIFLPQHVVNVVHQVMPDSKGTTKVQPHALDLAVQLGSPNLRRFKSFGYPISASHDSLPQAIGGRFQPCENWEKWSKLTKMCFKRFQHQVVWIMNGLLLRPVSDRDIAKHSETQTFI